MPPHLRSGIPVDQRLEITPKAVVFCNCSPCQLYHTVDPVSKAVLRGQYIGRSERKEHVQAEKSSTVGAAYYGTLQPNSTNCDRPSRAADLAERSPQPIATTKCIFSDAILLKLRSIDRFLAQNSVHDLVVGASVVFRTPPNRFSEAMTTLNLDKLVLEDAVISNADVVRLERWLASAKSLVNELQDRSLVQQEQRDDLKSLESRIKSEIRVLNNFKMSQWEAQRQVLCGMPEQVRVVEMGRYTATPFTLLHPLVVSCHILIAFMHFICSVSLKKCGIMISALRLILSLSTSGSPDLGLHDMQSALPKDPATTLSFLDLEPATKAFVCCPRCFQIYGFDPKSPSPTYPERCSYKATRHSSVCNQSLRKLSNSKKSRGGNSKNSKNFTPQSTAPIRLYLHHELHDWIASLHSRPEIVAHLAAKLPDKRGPGEPIVDILETPEIRSFLGPEGDPKLPFLEPKGNEGRLVFSLNMDGFNPFSNKESGKKVSTGAIYLVCLNLPPAIRHDVENIFLAGIIPGPVEPSKEQINHILKPLVDDLLLIWHDGFFLTSTTAYPQGRLVRGAVIPLVCDLPAARQMSGFAGHSSNNFCSLCDLKADQINNFDYETWKSRTRDEHMRIATEWKTAPSEKRRAELYDFYGIRWSELLRLPYWDPTRFVVIDSMHAFFLRLFQRHIRQIWGMSVDSADGDGPSVEILAQDMPSYQQMLEARQVLRSGSESALRRLKVNALRELSQATSQLIHSGTKKMLVRSLLKFRIMKGWFDNEGNVIGDETETLPIDPCYVVDPVIPLEKSKKNKTRRPVDDPPTSEEVQAGLLSLQTGPRKKIQSMRKALLIHLCNSKSVVVPPKCSVKDLVDLLEQWRIDQRAFHSEIVPDTQRQIKTKGTKVLGRETLREIREDMERLNLPAWVARAPSQPGVAKRGKFSADQWRSFCTFNLVFTLTRLWGSEPEGSRKRRMLDNYLHLVTAVKTATMRCVTPQRIAQYTFHMHQYLTSLLDLYPGTTISPYQHMSLHFQVFLQRFGPTHSWRCFPFERYNFLLQNIPTNGKFGELEQTMFTKFCMGQNLRILSKSHHLPAELDELVAEWERYFKTDIRGTLRGDALSFDERFQEIEERESWKVQDTTILPDDWYMNLKNWVELHDPNSDSSFLLPNAYMRQKVLRLGETYRTAHTSASDSQVNYLEIDGTTWAGYIEGIFSHTRTRRDGTARTQTFFIVKQYQPLPEEYEEMDAYRRFSETSGKIYRSTCFRGTTIVDNSQLLYHFARGDISLPGFKGKESLFVALPLDRS